MNVTVAICTWNRSKLLDQTLARMRELAVPARLEWEVLVVDNNSTDDTRAVLERHAAAGALPLRHTVEARQGHSHARNCAVAAARGELLVWTDDDVLVEPDWLTEYAKARAAFPGAAFFGGQIVPWYEVPPPGWAVRHKDRIGYCWAVVERDRAVRPLAGTEYAVGANMAFRTAVLRKYPFDPALGRVGNVLVSGEETRVQDQIRRDGGTGVWVGTASVRHFVPAARLTLGYIRRFHYEGFRATARQTDWAAAGPRLFGAPRWLLRRYLAALLTDAALRPVKSRRWMEAFLDRAKFAGYLAEARAAGAGRATADAATEGAAR